MPWLLPTKLSNPLKNEGWKTICDIRSFSGKFFFLEGVGGTFE